LGKKRAYKGHGWNPRGNSGGSYTHGKNSVWHSQKIDQFSLLLEGKTPSSSERRARSLRVEEWGNRKEPDGTRKRKTLDRWGGFIPFKD